MMQADYGNRLQRFMPRQSSLIMQNMGQAHMPQSMPMQPPPQEPSPEAQSMGNQVLNQFQQGAMEPIRMPPLKQGRVSSLVNLYR